MNKHKPYCAKIIAINNETPFSVRCDCQKNKEELVDIPSCRFENIDFKQFEV